MSISELFFVIALLAFVIAGAVFAVSPPTAYAGAAWFFMKMEGGALFISDKLHDAARFFQRKSKELP